MTHDEMIAVIQAHKEGKAIEYRYANDTIVNWTLDDRKGPLRADFNFYSYDYRIKPEPPKPREFTLRKCTADDSKHQWVVNPRSSDCPHCEVITVREVLP